MAAVTIPLLLHTLFSQNYFTILVYTLRPLFPFFVFSFFVCVVFCCLNSRTMQVT